MAPKVVTPKSWGRGAPGPRVPGSTHRPHPTPATTPERAPIAVGSPARSPHWPSSPRAYSPMRRRPGLCPDVDQARTGNGTPVILWTRNGGADRQWKTT
ncbi:hypothetical protein [Microbispora hainanensis]|uniref:RICIN domain-containing protein n=1 Tax=Microbispora hainanensis TaxID=568844 RepID=A0ABZ1SU36_9ACTN|nr:hypothetical protein [Microbispora hainanensis]